MGLGPVSVNARSSGYRSVNARTGSRYDCQLSGIAAGGEEGATVGDGTAAGVDEATVGVTGAGELRVGPGAVGAATSSASPHEMTVGARTTIPGRKSKGALMAPRLCSHLSPPLVEADGLLVARFSLSLSLCFL